MCSNFGIQMENYQQGDLTDIVRASGGQIRCGTGASDVPVNNWQFPSDPMAFSSAAMAMIDDSNREKNGNTSFGDPFSNMRDPLLHELNMAGSGYFGGPNSTDVISTITTTTTTATATTVDDSDCFCSSSRGGIGGGHGGAGAGAGVGSSSFLGQKNIFVEDEIKSPCNIFSHIQISQSPKQSVSPCDSPVMAAASPRGIKPPCILPGDMINVNSPKGCLLDNTAPVQISSPRNLGIKRRKSQAKKVVCIPAPAAANSRSSGEVVPSDLWAWRKYGQKPIKGSPYPRGYYRCSSSKGCSARKQVERSRTDPNMLVITYTSEHNHPWPTQRNALAGSTRSQPSKSNNVNAASTSKSSPSSQPQSTTTTKEEMKESSNDTMSPPNVIGGSSSASASVKEEIEDIDKHLEMDDADQFGEGFSHSYRPALPESHQSEDFFADLDEIEPDPLKLLFSRGFNGDENKDSKAMDPFSLFDWSGDNNATTTNNNNNNSFGETKGGFIARP